MPSPLLLVVDGNAILHRAHHALPPMTAPDGRVVNAAYGFLSVLFKALTEFRPTHVAVTFDRPEETFRQRLFKDYQAQREEQPEDLYAQIPILKDVLAGLGIPVHEAAGYEADDVIGTIAELVTTNTKRGTAGAPHVVIVSGDKDLLQLVTDRVEVVLLRRGMTDTARYDPAAVMERFGFPPERMTDYKALAGDPSDNYPGVPGIGEVTATALVNAFGSVRNILKAAKAKERPAALSEKLAKKIRDHAADVELGLTLATIVRGVPITFDLGDCARGAYDRERVVSVLRALGFTSLIGRLPEHGGAQSDDGAAALPSPRGTPHLTIDLLTDVPTVRKAIAEARAADAVAVAGVARDDDPRHGHPIGLGIAYRDRAVGITPWGTALAASVGLLRDANVPKDVHGAKALLHLLRRSKIDLAGLRYDTEILHYLLAQGSRNHDLRRIAFSELGVEGEQESGVKNLETGNREAEQRAAAERAGHEAALVARLVPVLTQKVRDAGLERVYEDIDRPLVPVLQRMEEVGVRIDVDHLAGLGKRMRRELDAADRKVFALAGHPFNIDSPQQLKTVLFEELGLAARGLKKTAKGGALSTAASELEKLRGAHPIVEHVLRHRELQKLLSTYVEALPALVDPLAGRVHTTYHQTVTATGRLSSSDPNLQNIPVNEPWGPEIRRAFVAEEGWVLLALDYSQFELRIAAALSGDRALLAAFRRNADIHAATGAEVFGVAPEHVTRDQRRIAKAINFGILYGMGASALAATAGTSREEAEAHIQRYFAAFPELAAWIETARALAAKRGYAETLFGRKRFLPELASGVPQVRAAAERMAVNMPVQGTQADLLRIAMVRADAWIRDGHADDVHMVLTVHDELVFEVREGFVADAAAALRGILEHAAALPVPIVVEAKAGPNWTEMTEVER